MTKVRSGFYGHEGIVHPLGLVIDQAAAEDETLTEEDLGFTVGQKPSEEWSHKQLDAYAAHYEVEDFPSNANKPDKVDFLVALGPLEVDDSVPAEDDENADSNEDATTAEDEADETAEADETVESDENPDKE